MSASSPIFNWSNPFTLVSIALAEKNAQAIIRTATLSITEPASSNAPW